MTTQNAPESSKKSLNFIEQIVEDDLKAGLNNGRIQTRFPPEPNGYLHIGHAKAICLDFSIAEKYNGECYLRFDDTNPSKEDKEYVDSIQKDIKWLGFDWKKLCYTSDYFQQLYDLAVRFINEGKAYVDEQSAEVIATQKGTPTSDGTESPFRNRSIAENLDLFERMNKGEFADGSMVLRAKIDMTHSNMHFRDPIMYRIITEHPHHRTGNQWKVYPMYDFAHGQSDYFEGVTHSICTLEFEVHRPLYNWFLEQFTDTDYRPKQREFNRLNITNTVMSKRKMLQLVQEKLVNGWDDPRMPTISGLRRRGYTSHSIRNFMNLIGYTKVEGMIDHTLLEHCVREDLKPMAPRVCAIMDPIKMIVTNYPEGQTEALVIENNQDNEDLGTREMQFGREIFIERTDFMEGAPNSFYRFSPGGREVRLKGAYIMQCTDCKKNEAGEIEEIYVTYDPETKSGTEGSKRKVKSTINWVEASSSLPAEIRVYENLFSIEDPSASDLDFRELINPESLKVYKGARVETYLKNAQVLEHFQFLKNGYFCVDSDSTDDCKVFNRTVTLKDFSKKKGKR